MAETLSSFWQTFSPSYHAGGTHQEALERGYQAGALHVPIDADRYVDLKQVAVEACVCRCIMRPHFYLLNAMTRR